MTVPCDVETRVLERAAYIEEAVSILAEKRALDKDTYLENRTERAIVEREFHTAIEACIDIAGMIIGATREEMPERYAGRFGILEDMDVISPATAARMREAAGFRNVLAHRYGSNIDHERVYEHLQNELDILVTFLDEIGQFLESGAS